MSFDQLVAPLSQAATWITVLLVLLTLVEMTRQRRSAYRPELVITTTPVYGHVGDRPFPDRWSDSEVELAQASQELHGPQRLHLLVHNIGLGAATTINLRWKFDLQEIKSSIAKLSAQDHSEVNIDLSKEDLLEFVYGPTHVLINLKNDLSITKDYLLPSSVDASGLLVHLPMSYVYLASAIIYFNLKHRTDQSPNKIFTVDVPNIELDLDYRDIGGSRHKNHLVGKLQLNYLRIDRDDPKPVMFAAILEFAKGWPGPPNPWVER